MKITKSQLKQIIKEELSSVISEVKILKQGFFKGADNVEWEIFDDGRICFETHHEEDYSPSSLCVPLDELKQIVGSHESPDAMGGKSRNEYMWDKTAEAFPEEYEGAENPFKMPEAPATDSQEHQRRRFYKNK